MFNPLFENTKKLKDQELEDRILELNKKYSIAARMGQGGVAQQIALAIDMYREEQTARYLAATSKINRKDGDSLDDLINVD